MATTYSDWKEYRRYRALELYRQGEKKSQIARTLGVDASAVTKWLKWVEQAGEQALKARISSGRPRNLTPEQLAQLPALLDQGAEAHGLPGAYWTRQRVAWLLEERYQVSYSAQHVGRLLRELGYSLQKPIRRDYRQSAEALQDRREERLVAEQKKPRPSKG